MLRFPTRGTPPTSKDKTRIAIGPELPPAPDPMDGPISDLPRVEPSGSGAGGVAPAIFIIVRTV